MENGLFLSDVEIPIAAIIIDYTVSMCFFQPFQMPQMFVRWYSYDYALHQYKWKWFILHRDFLLTYKMLSKRTICDHTFWLLPLVHLIGIRTYILFLTFLWNFFWQINLLFIFFSLITLISFLLVKW